MCIRCRRGMKEQARRGAGRCIPSGAWGRAATPPAARVRRGLSVTAAPAADLAQQEPATGAPPYLQHALRHLLRASRGGPRCLVQSKRLGGLGGRWGAPHCNGGTQGPLDAAVEPPHPQHTAAECAGLEGGATVRRRRMQRRMQAGAPDQPGSRVVRTQAAQRGGTMAAMLQAARRASLAPLLRATAGARLRGWNRLKLRLIPPWDAPECAARKPKGASCRSGRPPKVPTRLPLPPPPLTNPQAAPT